MAPIFTEKLTKIKLTDVFGTKRHYSPTKFYKLVLTFQRCGQSTQRLRFLWATLSKLVRRSTDRPNTDVCSSKMICLKTTWICYDVGADHRPARELWMAYGTIVQRHSQVLLTMHEHEIDSLSYNWACPWWTTETMQSRASFSSQIDKPVCSD